jgi:hypothetical protein
MRISPTSLSSSEPRAVAGPHDDAAKKRAATTIREQDAEAFPELADDPVWQAYLNAPVGEPETPEQCRMAKEAMRGPFSPGPVVTAEIAARCPPRGK